MALFICKVCGREFFVSPAKKQKYCSRACMLQDPEYIQHIKDGVRAKYENGKGCSEVEKQRLINITQTYWDSKLGPKEERHVKIPNRITGKGSITLDVTNKWVDDYRAVHTVCEICGSPETARNKVTGKINKLAIDHDHGTNKFRGLLCSNCNARLGWYERNRTTIYKYLKRGKISILKRIFNFIKNRFKVG